MEGSRSNASILIESPYMTQFVGNCTICHIGHHFQAIFCYNLHDFDYDLENGPMSKVNIPIENPYMTCYLMVIVIVTLSITIPRYYLLKCA